MVLFDIDLLRIMSSIELSKEIGGSCRVSVFEESHQMRFLAKFFNSIYEFQLTLSKKHNEE
jgi:hypothetical protein